MVPLRIQGPGWVRKADDAPHRSTAFRHAALHRRPGLWGDDPDRPTSAVWLREGDDGAWEAFGAGRASPAIEWLANRAPGSPIVLLAPPSWEGPIRLLGGRVEAGSILTYVRRGPSVSLRPARAPVRRIMPEDGDAFEAAAPPWALRSWGEASAMFAHGVAFGVPTGGGFASVAWTYESDLEHDKIGVATRPRYRHLGLAAAAASSLIEHVVRERGTTPIWVTTPDNSASIALAGSLGFSDRVVEKLLRWSPIIRADS